MDVIQSLRAVNSYPIPTATLHEIAEGCGLDTTAETTAELRASTPFKRAKAHAYIFLSTAPNLSQNGISFSFTVEERKRFRAMAASLLAEIGDGAAALGSGYGYVGEDF